ncbi:MAG: HD domain-containing protein, partial [Bacteroidia bacterium]|nr:HD domain-containing protein [Bacteroidia bacterium]
MSENQSMLLPEAQTFVNDLFLNKVSKSIRFHSIEHTMDVVSASMKMAEFYQLAEEDRLILSLAAWFHDTGYSSGKADDHEAVSLEIATDFLKSHNADPILVHRVTSAIAATRLPQTPNNHLEQILCDADLFHLGTDEFKEKSRLLRQEFKTFSKIEISKKQWRKQNIIFLESHKYFTTYGREKLQPEKERHLLDLKKKEIEEGKPDKKNKLQTKAEIEVEKTKAAADLKKKKENDAKTERGISTVFRIMASNQSNLSQMADSKAHIMISVNSIILSIVISLLLKQLETYSNLIPPTIILTAVCVTTIVFSILATRPNISTGKFTREDIENKQTNLLFFGNFHNMPLPDYDWAMTEMLNDKNYLYS